MPYIKVYIVIDGEGNENIITTPEIQAVYSQVSSEYIYTITQFP